MVPVGGDNFDVVILCEVCIVCRKVVLNRFDSQGGGMERVLVRSPSKVGMVTPSQLCIGVCSKGGVGSVGIMPGVFARVAHWCVSGTRRI